MPSIPKGALQWIKDTMSPEFFGRAKQAMNMAKDTGNEHAVTQGYRNWVSPVAEGERYGVSPNYPQHSRYKFALPREIVARMHTHPVDSDFGITVAPSTPDLDQFILNSKGKPIRDMIVSPDKNTFVDFSRSDQLDWKGLDKLYFDLMKHTQGNMNGIEPIKPDVYFSALRKASENRNSGTRMAYDLGDEAPYADEVFSTLKQLGLKKGGLVQMRECSCGG